LRQLQQSAEQFFNQGNGFFERGNFSDALVQYNQAIAHREDYVDAWYQKGRCLAQLNSGEEAIASYNQTLKLKPNSSLPWVGKGDVFAGWSRFQEALDCYEKALSFNSGDQETSLKCDRMIEELQKLETEGEKLLQEAINLTNSQQYQEAMKIYDQALELISKNLVSAC
jgi:tetratricopeptide (TPR) repeat protein